MSNYVIFPSSKQLEKAKYHPDEQRLEVHFPNGERYDYHSVTPAKYKTLLYHETDDNESAGKYFHAHIKTHPFTKVEEDNA